MSRKTYPKIALTAIMAIALVFSASAPSFADAYAKYERGGTLRSEAYYNASSDVISTHDMRKDGWGSRVRWELNKGGGGSLDNTQGAGTSKSVRPSTGQSTRIKIKSCSIKKGIEKGCGKFTSYSNL